MKSRRRVRRPPRKEPKSKGTGWAERTRAHCNKLTRAEREKLMDRAMQIAYGVEAEPAANHRS